MQGPLTMPTDHAMPTAHCPACPHRVQLKSAGFTEPTPIQAQAWPVAMEGRDVVAIAKTGSGKTCGFLLPGFMHIRKAATNPMMGPTVLVLAPTRELANQIQAEANKFGHLSGLRNTYAAARAARMLLRLASLRPSSRVACSLLSERMPHCRAARPAGSCPPGQSYAHSPGAGFM
jgi:DEAD/DEAH box helicase